MTAAKPQSRSPNIARHLAVIAGVAILLWSGMEDNDAVMVSLLGALSAAAAILTLGGAARFPARWRRGSLTKRAVVAGTLTGALASLTTPALMLFKNLRHAHVFPDYPPAMLLAMLERLPWWALAGALAGFGIGVLLSLARETRSQPG